MISQRGVYLKVTLPHSFCSHHSAGETGVASQPPGWQEERFRQFSSSALFLYSFISLWCRRFFGVDRKISALQFYTQHNTLTYKQHVVLPDINRQYFRTFQCVLTVRWGLNVHCIRTNFFLCYQNRLAEAAGTLSFSVLSQHFSWFHDDFGRTQL